MDIGKSGLFNQDEPISLYVNIQLLNIRHIYDTSDYQEYTWGVVSHPYGIRDGTSSYDNPYYPSGHHSGETSDYPMVAGLANHNGPDQYDLTIQIWKSHTGI